MKLLRVIATGSTSYISSNSKRIQIELATELACDL